MSDSFKPRIDFAGPLTEEKSEQFKSSQAVDGETAEKFAPVAIFGAGHVGAALVQGLAPLPLQIQTAQAQKIGIFNAGLP